MNPRPAKNLRISEKNRTNRSLRGITHAGGLCVLLLLIASIPLLPVILGGRFPATHELIRYELLGQLFSSAQRMGTLYPRWIIDLAGGHGYPTFLFYQPLVFFVAAIIDRLPGVSPSRMIWATDYLFLFVGTCGAFRLARLQLGRVLSMFAATVFVLTPFVFVNLLVRGDHSELAAMMLSPWPLWGLMATERRIRDGDRCFTPAMVAAITHGLIVYAHPVFAMLYTPVIGLLAVARTVSIEKGSRSRWVTIVACIFTVSACASSSYWFTVYQNAKHVQLQQAAHGNYDASKHTVGLATLFSHDWGFGFSPTIGNTSRPGDMPRPLGLPHFLIAAVGAAIAIRRRRPWAVAVACAYGVLIILMTAPAVKFWTLGPLKLAQFPWRLLSVIAVFQLLLIIEAVAALRTSSRQLFTGCGVLVAIVLWHWPMLQISPGPFLIDGRLTYLSWSAADQWIVRDASRMRNVDERFALMNEFDPRWEHEHAKPRGDAPIAISAARIVSISVGKTIRIEADAGDGDVLIFRQHYFPGWRIEVNGKRVPDDELRANVTPEGLMRINLTPGRCVTTATFDGPEHWRLRSLLAGLFGTAAVLLLLKLSAKNSL